MLYNSCFFTRTTHFSLLFICFFSYSRILILPFSSFSSFYLLSSILFVIFHAIFPSSLSVVYVAVLRQPPLHPQKQKKSEHSRTSVLRRQDSFFIEQQSPVAKRWRQRLLRGNGDRRSHVRISKNKRSPSILGLLSCGGRIRTCDLQVMSLASYQLLHSAMFFR